MVITFECPIRARRHTDVPPKITIKIDVKAEYEDLTELGYIYKKTQKLLNFDVEKVIWIITSVGKVTVSTQEKIGKSWTATKTLKLWMDIVLTWLII